MLVRRARGRAVFYHEEHEAHEEKAKPVFVVTFVFFVSSVVEDLS